MHEIRAEDGQAIVMAPNDVFTSPVHSKHGIDDDDGGLPPLGGFDDPASNDDYVLGGGLESPPGGAPAMGGAMTGI